MTTSITEFQWTPQAESARFIDTTLAEFVEAIPFLQKLQQRMHDETGTHLRDWVDHFVLPHTDERQRELDRLGFEQQEWNGEPYREQPAGIFPVIRLLDVPLRQLVLKVDRVDDFLRAQGLAMSVTPEGPPGAIYRRARVTAAGDAELWCCERHGTRTFQPQSISPDLWERVQQHRQLFLHRERNFDTDEAGFAHATQLARAAMAEIGRDRCCEIFFEAEREYWQSRNRAARIQRGRQDRLGLGWANHDHHTYRSSRTQFAPLIAFLELLGFECRERFYPGHNAGWGAQVLEQPVAGVVIFADVDLSPEELAGDFAHEPLADRDQLGTVGLWCRLHGEAFLQAGMHHLECQFNFEAEREQLKQYQIETMKPFTDLPHLKQAFTRGEIWTVSETRLQQALADGVITPPQAEKFRAEGALGSHMEILERWDGYKGFNQTGINEIIAKTDPRHA